ncbi:unnamed protein product [Dovyalis caffra]|uniref:Pentatricopeptide repeat-containing protein n=1 Tax=Dovyalis caffra TaxID=77055 RepID=A0AAV1SFI1_9ROSI|nr:unnamed protein product [Dovyalis caffra]
MSFLQKSNPKPWQWHYVHGISKVLKAFSFSKSTFPSCSSSSRPKDSLHSRISKARNEKVSVIPVIEQWLHEGKTFKQSQLHDSIKHLRKNRRFSHALQAFHKISQWTSDQKGYDQSTEDFAVRLDLISKVHGIERVEEYYNRIPDRFRDIQVYGTILDCYVRKKHLEKAEAMMQKMKELRFVKVRHYNVMLSLYNLMGKHEKLDTLVKEMEEKGIHGDMCAFNIRLNAYGAISNIEEMEKLLNKMETDPRINIDWNTCFVVANGYLKAGLIEKALPLLKRAEQLIGGTRGNSKRLAYEVLLTLYGAAKNKIGVYRVWNFYKDTGGLFNSGYQCMISSLMKLDDFADAERILEEWLLRKTSFDVQIPNAEAFVKKIVEGGIELPPSSWDRLATGYLVGGQIVKAVGTLKKAISVSKLGWKLNFYALTACLEGLKGQGNVEEAEELLNLVREHCHFSPAMYDKLKTSAENGNFSGEVFQLEGDDQTLNGEIPAFSEVKNNDSAEL